MGTGFDFIFYFYLKGVGMPWAKKLILVVSNRGAQDKLFGVVLTLLRPRVCLPDTIQFSKISFWGIAISDHMTPRRLKFFITGMCLKIWTTINNGRLVTVWPTSSPFRDVFTKFSFFGVEKNQFLPD